MGSVRVVVPGVKMMAEHMHQTLQVMRVPLSRESLPKIAPLHLPCVN